MEDIFSTPVIPPEEPVGKNKSKMLGKMQNIHQARENVIFRSVIQEANGRNPEVHNSAQFDKSVPTKEVGYFVACNVTLEIKDFG